MLINIFYNRYCIAHVTEKYLLLVVNRSSGIRQEIMTPSRYKDGLSRYEDFHYKDIIFIIVIPVLVRRRLYIQTVPMSHAVRIRTRGLLMGRSCVTSHIISPVIFNNILSTKTYSRSVETSGNMFISQWRHNDHHGVSNHLPSIVCATVCLSWHQRKHQSPRSWPFVRGMRRSPVNSPQKGPVTRKMFPYDDVIMIRHYYDRCWCFTDCCILGIHSNSRCFHSKAQFIIYNAMGMLFCGERIYTAMASHEWLKSPAARLCVRQLVQTDN